MHCNYLVICRQRRRKVFIKPDVTRFEILICIALTGVVLYLAGLWDLRNRLVHEQFSKEHGVLRRVHSSVRYHVPGSDVHLLGFAGYMAKPGEQEAK